MEVTNHVISKICFFPYPKLILTHWRSVFSREIQPVGYTHTEGVVGVETELWEGSGSPSDGA